MKQKTIEFSETTRKGAEAALQMLSDLRGKGTDGQALDHIVSRMQDKYGAYTLAVLRALNNKDAEKAIDRMSKAIDAQTPQG